MPAIVILFARVLRGKSPLAADRYHFHHLLQRLGLTPGWALYAWLFVAACFMAVGVAGQYAGVSEAVRCVAFLACFVLYSLVLNSIWRRLGSVKKSARALTLAVKASTRQHVPSVRE